MIFFLGLKDEDMVKRAIEEVDGRLSVIGSPGGIPLARLAELGVWRVSFGPGTLGLTLAALQRAATTLVALGEYPEDLGFEFELQPVGAAVVQLTQGRQSHELPSLVHGAARRE